MDEEDIISWQEFVDDPSVTLNTRRTRRMVIGQLAKANGFESPTLLLDRIRLDKDKPSADSDKLTPYRASRKYIFGLIAPGPIDRLIRPFKMTNPSLLTKAT